MPEPGGNPFASLASLKTKLVNDEEATKKQEQINQEAKRKQDQERQEAKAKKAQNAFFERALKGKFQDFPPASYESVLKDVRSITVAQASKDFGFLPVMVAYEKQNGIAGRASFQVLNNGMLSGEKIPNELSHLTKQNIIDEVARIAETIGVGMWHKLDVDILPDSDSLDDMFGERGSELPSRPAEKENVKIDPERLRFLSEQPDFKFGVMSKNWGFTSKGYEIAVLSKCIVFENHVKGNAAFVISLGETIKLSEEMQKRTYKGKVMNKDDAQILANKYLKLLLEEATSRRQLVEKLRAVRVVHQGNVWQQKMQQTIEKFQSETFPED